MNQSLESKETNDPEKVEKERLSKRIRRASKKELDECVNKINEVLDQSFIRHSPIVEQAGK